MKRQSCNILASMVFAFLIAFQGAGAWADSPTAVVKGFQHSLIAAMKMAEKASVQERYDHLEPRVKQAFYVPLMARMATGERYWNSASKSERGAVVSAFARMSVATLATLFDGYSGESFAIEGVNKGAQGAVLVRSKLTKSDGETIQFDYRAIKIRDQWRLIDIILDNSISELQRKIDEYEPTLKKSGVPGLIRLLNQTADKLMSPS